MKGFGFASSERRVTDWVGSTFYLGVFFNTVVRVDIPALSQVDVESQAASVERALNNYKQKQKPKLIDLKLLKPYIS